MPPGRHAVLPRPPGPCLRSGTAARCAIINLGKHLAKDRVAKLVETKLVETKLVEILSRQEEIRPGPRGERE
ncbi:MAG TPA: hypothetical protein VH913_11720 [Hyphomicrobiaceae bacterium]|jgi:hypothetical protein